MSQQSVKWALVKRYFSKRNYEIKFSGGDAYIYAPRDGNNEERSRNVVKIGHKCSNRGGAEVWDSVSLHSNGNFYRLN